MSNIVIRKDRIFSGSFCAVTQRRDWGFIYRMTQAYSCT